MTAHGMWTKKDKIDCAMRELKLNKKAILNVYHLLIAQNKKELSFTIK